MNCSRGLVMEGLLVCTPLTRTRLYIRSLFILAWCGVIVCPLITTLGGGTVLRFGPRAYLLTTSYYDSKRWSEPPQQSKLDALCSAREDQFSAAVRKKQRDGDA